MVKPTDFPTQSEIACTIPSPGLGMIRMFRDIAAPIPVRMIPAARIRSLDNILSDGAGSRAEKRFIKRVNTRLKGSCRRSIKSTSFKSRCAAGAMVPSASLEYL